MFPNLIPHPTLADLPNDLVMADGLAEHETPPHLCSAVTVNGTPGRGFMAMKIAKPI